MGADTWSTAVAERRPALDQRYPHHAALLALARLPEPLPRTILWSPGNQALHGGAWSREEERVLCALSTRLGALGVAPRLVLALPPQPLEERLQDKHRERREVLLRAAQTLSWEVLDLARVAGEATTANRVADGLFAPYPVGTAQERVRAAIADAAAR
jgi:hypothetical protein